MKNTLNRVITKSALALLSLAIFSSCTTNENKAEKLDDKLEVKEKMADEKIGLNEDGEVIVQSETTAGDELRSQMWVNSKLEDKITREYDELKRCREDLSDPRLGGSGNVTDIPQIDDLETTTEVKEKFGIDSETGQLKFVKKEFFMARLKKERKYEKTMRKMSKIIVKHNSDCQRNMTRARVKSGLPGKRYDASGYFTDDGVWVGDEKAEKNLDDAFERAAKAKAKAKQRKEDTERSY